MISRQQYFQLFEAISETSTQNGASGYDQIHAFMRNSPRGKECYKALSKHIGALKDNPAMMQFFLDGFHEKFSLSAWQPNNQQERKTAGAIWIILQKYSAEGLSFGIPLVKVPAGTKRAYYLAAAAESDSRRETRAAKRARTAAEASVPTPRAVATSSIAINTEHTGPIATPMVESHAESAHFDEQLRAAEAQQEIIDLENGLTVDASLPVPRVKLEDDDLASEGELVYFATTQASVTVKQEPKDDSSDDDVGWAATALVDTPTSGGNRKSFKLK